MARQVCDFEEYRLKVLHQLGILDTPREERFDRIIMQAKELFGVPIALLSLVDRDRQWFKSAVGLEVRETPRCVSFCSLCIADRRPLVVVDALEDPRVQENPLVTSEPHIRFYAGVPLELDGAALGTLCIIDTNPRVLSQFELKALETLARWAETEIREADTQSLNRQLVENKKKYRTIFQDSSRALAVLDAQGAVLETNKLGSLLWPGLSGHSLFEGLLPGTGRQQLEEAIERARNGQAVFVEPFAYKDCCGRELAVSASITPLDVDGGQYLLALEDVSDLVELTNERTRLIAENEQILHETREAQARQDLFLSAFAHEMRNPIMGILGTAELLREQPEKFGPEAVEDLHTCATALSTLIDDALDMERIRQGRIKIEDRSFDLGSLLRGVVNSVKTDADRRGVTFELDVAAELSTLRGDPGRIRQIVSNFVSNAVKYGASPGVVRVTARLDGAHYQVSVEDSGQGITEAVLQQIFEPYFQVSRQAGDSRDGIGLGLSIVRGLARLLGGEVGARSVLGEGSTFWFRAEFKAGESLASSVDPHTGAISAKVLVVDDNPINRRVLNLQLSNGGATVLLAEDGSRALDVLTRERIDVVLLDCQMPVMDGYEAAARIKSDPGVYGSPIVIALTAAADQDAQDRCLRAGMDDFLRKPVRHIDLRQKLVHHLAGR